MKTLLRKLLSVPMGLIYVALVVYSRRGKWLRLPARKRSAWIDGASGSREIARHSPAI